MNAFYFLIKLTNRNLRRVKIGLGGSFVGSIYAENFIINIKKYIKKWILYSKCMINGYSIRKCAEIVEISVPTSFYCRHKFLDAIRVYMGIGNVGGVIEVDEAFFRESFKGNHKKSTTFTMPREPHRRGIKGRMNHTDLERLFAGRIEDNSTICTDSHKSYIKFAKNSDVELQLVKRGKHRE
ncbi:IS1595 family transposase [Clostridium estertheticum]|uniref:IS1595 family transposase n=1 Tax=Clostridium estertheticum TaxID=238834 RepID=UPI0013EE5A1D|nr:IS1595 family transposase [Clostridium estertheticum]MBZ9607190.1 IS1595 family transposase [Clostridium estertheticum]